ncbi:HAD-IB family phosphatase [Clostridioides sp. ZZV15-6383]|nr:HAD-IB family phosphatase [Clostridioides sp. ZZV15-6383]
MKGYEMKNYKFVFDLDSTLTKQEILPEISKCINKYELMQNLTNETMLGNLSFEESFKKRVDLLKYIPISKVKSIVTKINLNEKIVKFIKENPDRCTVVTNNLDLWICDLMKELSLENKYYSSIAHSNGDFIDKIKVIIKKEDIIKKMKGPIVAVGDGSNDIKMIENADIGIGFGGVRPIAPGILKVCDYAFYEEERLCQLLKQLL